MHAFMPLRGRHALIGYLNKPDAYEELIDADGWLHTGDIGYYDEQEWFYIVDRCKELIKVKGNQVRHAAVHCCTGVKWVQVAPAELEDVLVSHAHVFDAAVIGIKHDKHGEVPHAFVVRADGALSEDDVKVPLYEINDLILMACTEVRCWQVHCVQALALGAIYQRNTQTAEWKDITTTIT
jgi:acyl-CoA synthetase (AMP-forming)/AMP-acid ligase II